MLFFYINAIIGDTGSDLNLHLTKDAFKILKIIFDITLENTLHKH